MINNYKSYKKFVYKNLFVNKQIILSIDIIWNVSINLIRVIICYHS